VPTIPNILPGVDIKSDGGYIVVAPSLHPSGNRYKWIKHISSGPVDLPKDLEELIRSYGNTKGSFDSSILQGVSEGARNESAASVIGKILHGLKKEDWKTIGWQIFSGWNIKNNPPLPERELKSVFDSIASRELNRIATKLSQETFPSHNSLTSQRQWPEQIDEAAFCGIAGDIIRTIEPHSEADKAALLINFLTGIGSIIGDKAHIRVEDDKHPMRLFAVIVGETSKGRKGTSWGHIKNLLRPVDDAWYNNLATGLSSGEGLIYAVRDEIKKNKTDKYGNTKEIVEDAGVNDKRLLVIESEFSSTLKVIKREGNTLSPIIRSAWDSGNLRTLTKNSPTKATGAHISIIGHITKDEVLRHLDHTEYANGFGNRFLWICSKRSKVLPFGGRVSEDVVLSLVSRLRAIVSFAQSIDEIGWSDPAKDLWIKIYPELSEGKPGLVGALLGRAESYVTRLAGEYSLLDSSKIIQPEHLKAALAVWQYSEESVEYIFQSRTGDSLADRIYDLLLNNPNGLTKTQISEGFGRHKTSTDLTNSLTSLLNLPCSY